MNMPADRRHLSNPADPALPSDAGAVADWNLLFDAVKARLMRLASDEPRPCAPMRRMQLDVIDCVQALERIHAHFGPAVARGRRLELDAFDARIARARVVWPRPVALTFDQRPAA